MRSLSAWRQGVEAAVEASRVQGRTRRSHVEAWRRGQGSGVHEVSRLQRSLSIPVPTLEHGQTDGWTLLYYLFHRAWNHRSPNLSLSISQSLEPQVSQLVGMVHDLMCGVHASPRTCRTPASLEMRVAPKLTYYLLLTTYYLLEACYDEAQSRTSTWRAPTNAWVNKRAGYPPTRRWGAGSTTTSVHEVQLAGKSQQRSGCSLPVGSFRC